MITVIVMSQKAQKPHCSAPPRPSALTWPPSRRSFHPRRVFCSTCAQLELGYQRLTQCSFLVELILLSCSTEVQTWKWAENRTFTCTCVGMWYENSLTSFFSFIFGFPATKGMSDLVFFLTCIPFYCWWLQMFNASLVTSLQFLPKTFEVHRVRDASMALTCSSSSEIVGRPAFQTIYAVWCEHNKYAFKAALNWTISCIVAQSRIYHT